MDEDILSKHDADLHSLGLDVPSPATSKTKSAAELDLDAVSARSGSLSGDELFGNYGQSTVAADEYIVTSIEPESVRLWKQETKERIEKQQKESEEKIKLIKEKALKDIDEFKKARLTRINNTFAEIKTHKSINSDNTDLINNKMWSNVVTSSKLNTRPPYCLKDVTRMRKVLLSLKEQQDNATPNLV